MFLNLKLCQLLYNGKEDSLKDKYTHGIFPFKKPRNTQCFILLYLTFLTLFKDQLITLHQLAYSKTVLTQHQKLALNGGIIGNLQVCVCVCIFKISILSTLLKEATLILIFLLRRKYQM